jgi:Carboxypeptidase regulatory-like domain
MISSVQVLFCLLIFALASAAHDGSASLMGKVKDITGAGVPGTVAELSLESPAIQFRAAADSNGVYRFSGLQLGAYTLQLRRAGFHLLTVKSVQVSDGEQKTLPDLQLEVGLMADCGGHAVRDAIRLLPSRDRAGNLVGSVRIDEGPMAGSSAPVSGADVSLLCNTRKPCRRAKTDSNGEFRFDAVPAGPYSVRVERVGFYSLTEPGYTVEDGIESIYLSVYIEACSGNCDPRLRPKKPIATCQ